MRELGAGLFSLATICCLCMDSMAVKYLSQLLPAQSPRNAAVPCGRLVVGVCKVAVQFISIDALHPSGCLRDPVSHYWLSGIAMVDGAF